ncbi:unnamed protein product [Oikopleura dioica]|uniref:Uncharacterized protein n=1 Tax=Oikopleura dioica TaxID=34765 RepID=E4YMI7_OIKDI|nr:unnamed protein product [Oikopleura dioica]
MLPALSTNLSLNASSCLHQSGAHILLRHSSLFCELSAARNSVSNPPAKKSICVRLITNSNNLVSRTGVIFLVATIPKINCCFHSTVMERKPKWAWELYPYDDFLWTTQYHDDPMDHLLDPRRFDSTALQKKNLEPESSEQKPVYSDPSRAKSPTQTSLARMHFDEKLYRLAFGRVIRRPASPDNTFVGSDGCNTDALVYRTHPYEHRKPYPPRKQSEKLHFERLNATQFRLYSSENAKSTKSKDWLRCGSLFHDYVEAQNRKTLGDISSTDQQGLRYLLEKRIAENKTAPASERWTSRQIRRGRYYVNSLLESIVPDSEHFRNDLFVYNGRNNNNLQSIGMDSLTTIFVRKNPVTKEVRTDRTCQVLMELSKFENLCPNSEDRQLLRLMLGRGDDLKSSSYLLSPLDAALLSQSMLVLPRQERDLTIFKASHQGNIIGTCIASTQRCSQTADDSEVLFPSTNVTPPAYLPLKSVPVKVDRATVKHKQRTPWSTATMYYTACQELPTQAPSSSSDDPKQNPNADTVPSSNALPDHTQNLAQPVAQIEKTQPALNSVPHGPFERLQHAYNRIVDPVPPFSMEDFSSWLYLYQSASEDDNLEVVFPDTSPAKNTLETDLPPGCPSLQVPQPVHTCAVDPRNNFPLTYIHPPIRLGVRLYDDYRSSEEESDDDILRVFTPPPRFDTPTPDSDPELFSGLATPTSPDSSNKSQFLFPSPSREHSTGLSQPQGSSTPEKATLCRQKNDLPESYDPLLTKYSNSDSVYPLGPPGHRDPVNEDFPLQNPVQVSTCENLPEHSSNLFYMFTNRILQRGRRKELFFLAMAYPDASLYLHSARCLQGLTPAQRQRVIGPFTPEERSAYNLRFNPSRMEYTRRLETFDRLYSINVPDTSPDFDPVPTPPAFKYMAEKKLREALFPAPADPNQRRFGQKLTAEYVTESITDTDELEDMEDSVFSSEPSSSSSFPSCTVSDSELPNYEASPSGLSKKVSATTHFLGEIWGPYFNGDLLNDVPLDLSFDEFLDELDTQLIRGPIQLNSTEYNELPSNHEDQSTQFANLWARKQLSQLDNDFSPDANSDASSTCSSTYSTTESALTSDSDSDCDDNSVTHPAPLSDSDLLIPHVPQYTFSGESDLLQSLAKRGKAKQKFKDVATQFTVPPTLVLVPQGYHQHDTARKQTVSMDIHSTHVVHPIIGVVSKLDYDMTPDTYAHFHRREYNRRVNELPPSHSRETYSTELSTLLEYHRVDATTKIPYFVSGTIYNYLFAFLRPQTVSPGYQQALVRDVQDELSKFYPEILSSLRGNVDLTALPLTKFTLYSFLSKDPRFQIIGKYLHRPQLFHYTIRMLEPTLFAPSSFRPWILLLSDVDCHSWTPISSFALLCGRAEVLRKSMILSPADAVPTKVGVAHYFPTRPGLPTAFALSVSIGSLRPASGSRETIFSRWRLRQNGRLLVSLFVGAVQRISVAHAQRDGITSDAYDAAVLEHNNISKYYTTSQDEHWNITRVRRTDVFPPSLIGTYRAVYGEPTHLGAPPPLLCYEKYVLTSILWPSLLGFDHSIINAEHPHFVKTMTGGTFDVSYGGPRLILATTHPIEKELYDPYSFPHLEQDRESLIRVNSRGVVIYRAEEAELIRRLPENIQRLSNFHVPQSGCCYSRFYAQQSQASRPKDVFQDRTMPSQKPNTSLEFSSRNDYF